MTLKESYQNAYERKNKAVKAQLKTKKATLTAEKKRIKEQGEETLRAAYSDYMRSAAAAEQQNRAEGRFGGAAENQKAGLGAAHSQKRDALKADTAADIAAVEDQITTAVAAAEKTIANNDSALQQKLDQLKIKEIEAAPKAAAKTEKGGSSSSSSSSSSKKGLSPSQVLSMMAKGIYDERFAQILGVSDKDVQYYVRYAKLKMQEVIVEGEKDTRLPGTYKPPLK